MADTITINSQQLLRGDLYTELVDATLSGGSGVSFKSKLVKPLGALVTIIKSSAPSAETFATAISGRTVTIYSSNASTTSRVFVVIKGYRY